MLHNTGAAPHNCDALSPPLASFVAGGFITSFYAAHILCDIKTLWSLSNAE
jgi:hypothetical protein